MAQDPFEPPGTGLTTSWIALLDNARHENRVISVHLLSGDSFTGHVTRRGDALVTVESSDPATGGAREHNLAIHAIVSISYESPAAG
ncbi:hypothetical protein ACIBIZ_16275 [Nonomuraea spiralis]|uniref:hypothetical protein n=1 Tax=Nonomuraea TaxID=83681 RepID=UPI000F767351|nr:hypothetical protein [Nonomuraea sp. WAC 01424]RSN01161.1 hypothetical protein DMB42_39930 [Nonomuraea sp. WAC 01424]